MSGDHAEKWLRELDRIGGEAIYYVLSRDGFVDKAYFITRAPVRGFEKLVLGKNPVFVVNAMMRICGICHAAHGIASSEAFEDAMGIAPPYNGRLLREAIGLVNRVQSHIFHLMLLLPDIVSRDRLLQYIMRIIRIYNVVSETMGQLGGFPTHPQNLVIGGVLKAPSQDVVGNVIEKLRVLLGEYRSLVHDLESEYMEKVDYLRKTKYKPSFLATHAFYGDKYNFDIEQVSILRYEDYREDGVPAEAGSSTSLVALYRGKAVEVGPRARLSIYRDFAGESLWDIQVARFIEIEVCVERVIELLEKIEYGEPTYTQVLTFRRGVGIGVYEAPRGTLIHRVELDGNGRVKSYKIIVPTMFNIPHMEKAAIGFPEKYCDVIPRIYDPCIPCSTHVVKLESSGRG